MKISYILVVNLPLTNKLIKTLAKAFQKCVGILCLLLSFNKNELRIKIVKARAINPGQL
jgi:hypothetical protein